MTSSAYAPVAPLLTDPCPGYVTDLVSRCGQGEVAALADLFDVTFFFVSAIVSRGGRPAAGIDDGVVNAFVRIWARAATYVPGQQEVRAWLFDQVVEAADAAELPPAA